MSDEETQVEEADAKDQPDGGENEVKMDSDEVDQQMKEVEENPPERLEDWPDGPAKYRTIGGADANEDWEDSPAGKLGPADLRYHEGGDVSIRGEKVDNPDDYKGEPIPGGPTDPEAPDDPSGVGEDDD